MLPEIETGAATDWRELADGVTLREGAWTAEAERILTDEAVALVAQLHRSLDVRRQTLLAARTAAQHAYDGGALPDYLTNHDDARAAGWRVAPTPADLRDRRVEITGPINSPKMVINMLSRTATGDRADTAMLDFEDSMKPTWANVCAGVVNLAEAVAGTLEFSGGGKQYRLDPADMATIMIRVRGLHLAETNLRVDGQPVSGGMLDFALSMVHSARELVATGRTPTFYIPKCEHYCEARWWNRLFRETQTALGLPVGTLRATFLIETLPAAFQMEEILYEIREHAAGLNVGRWDKIFSDIKVLGHHADRVLADRASIGMNRPWMRNYALRLIEICHRRGAHAIGGMAAFTPGKTDEVRAAQTAKVAADKQLEASLGHDGCWVSHPYFIGIARAAFTRPDQRDVLPLDGQTDRLDLLPEGGGPRTLAGLRTNVRVGIGYLNGWQHGLGCVAWDDLMEDLATLEISRVQTWQWRHHAVALDDGPTVTVELIGETFASELAAILDETRAALAGRPESELQTALDGFTAAAAEAERLFTATDLAPFLTTTSDPT